MTATALVRPDEVVAGTASTRAEGGKFEARPSMTASCSNRPQPPLPPPRAGGLCLVEREASACRKSWSRRTVRTTHDKPNDTARVSEGQPGKRGRSREVCLVGQISLRRELGSNPVIGTVELTIREGHVPSCGDKERVRKICACCSAVCNTWDQFPEHSSFPRPRAVYGTERPSMGRSLRSESVSYSLIQHGHKRLCGSAAEPEPQDRPRKKTGNPTALAFKRVYPLRTRRRTREQSDRTGMPNPSHSRERGYPEKKQSTQHPAPFAQQRGANEVSGVCPPDVMLNGVEASEARRFLDCARNDRRLCSE